MRRFFRAVPVALLIASIATLVLSRGGGTVPLFAARTGNQCAQCHFDPNGGGPRNDFGFAYARNRHSLDPEPEGSAWRDLDLTNKVGEKMPLHLGVNQRFMLLTNNTKPIEGIDRLGFFNMENAIHFAFQPHHRLTLVYTADAFSSELGGAGVFRSKEAFGMIGGMPLNGYLKAGRFRSPFGLRLDDHTVATRNSFLDFSNQARFLPYDPRNPDMGIELGGDVDGWFGRLALTNGSADVFVGQHAETKSVKLGYNHASYQGAVSFYDSYRREPSLFEPTLKRATRWGYYGMTHYGPLTLLGELAAGTDEAEPAPGFASGAKTNRLAGFAELNYTPMRWLNLRGRYDHLQYDRSSDEAIRDLNTHSRYAFEAEVLPVPFAELRGTVRRIDHQDDSLEDETQGYLQFHFNY
jgi:hypothetical protein